MFERSGNFAERERALSLSFWAKWSGAERSRRTS